MTPPKMAPNVNSFFGRPLIPGRDLKREGRIKPIKEYPLNSYTSIGCYKSGDNHAVFSELGLTQAQCENAVLSYFGKNLKCELSYPKYSITSLTSLTIDICLQICTDNGFIYAGLI